MALSLTTALWAYVPSLLIAELAFEMESPEHLSRSIALSAGLNVATFLAVGLSVWFLWEGGVDDPITLSEAASSPSGTSAASASLLTPHTHTPAGVAQVLLRRPPALLAALPLKLCRLLPRLGASRALVPAPLRAALQRAVGPALGRPLRPHFGAGVGLWGARRRLRRCATSRYLPLSPAISRYLPQSPAISRCAPPAPAAAARPAPLLLRALCRSASPAASTARSSSSLLTLASRPFLRSGSSVFPHRLQARPLDSSSCSPGRPR